ncbi:hypothetical protein IAD21_00313 [Abditibacteriota bacterium]|nr:hypothetical protein IAD21_00313 [Abditibacteriota bacterium]
MHNTSENSFLRWQEVWDRKGAVAAAQLESGEVTALDLSELLAIDGYDTAASQIGTANWLTYVETIGSRLGLGEGEGKSELCEIGCGAGAFSQPLYQQGVQITGADYSAGLISICKVIMPKGRFEVAEACAVPFESATFDAVISGSVFIYFPTLEYAELAFAEIVRLMKPGGRAALLDLNDNARKQEYESIKMEKLGRAEYERMYKDHRHLFYDRAWIMGLAHKHNLQCVIEDQILAGYPNAAFRFNVFLNFLPDAG